MVRYSKYHAWFCLFLVSLMTLVQPLVVFADVMTPSNAFAVNPDYLIGSASNADSYRIATMELTDEDYYIQPFSSVGTVVNTIDNSLIIISITNGEFTNYFHVPCDLSNNRFSFSWSVPDMFSGYYVESIQFYIVNSDLKLNSLPRPSGNYLYSFDFSSDFSFDLQGDPYLQSVYVYLNSISDTVNTLLPYSFNSGDFYVNPFALKIGSSYSVLRHVINVDFDSRLEDIGGSFAIRFAPTDTEGAPLAGSDVSSSTAFENDLSSSLSDISSSIGDISSSMDSAAENLEYISTSQNLIIQGIDNVIMHISDQLYAFWDQLYNLIHEPTYARLGDILDALRAIANNSDIYSVVETIEESSEKQTADIIANNNANTSKVESAVEKHGNFIIDGLKGLFIPSDEYFKTYFDDLYSYFSDRFGFLSFPIDLLVRLIDLFANSSDRDCILTLPSFEISGEQLISEASFNLTEFLENDFSLVLSSIRMVTSIGLIMAFVSLCQTKWNEVMRN